MGRRRKLKKPKARDNAKRGSGVPAKSNGEGKSQQLMLTSSPLSDLPFTNGNTELEVVIKLKNPTTNETMVESTVFMSDFKRMEKFLGDHGRTITSLSSQSQVSTSGYLGDVSSVDDSAGHVQGTSNVIAGLSKEVTAAAPGMQATSAEAASHAMGVVGVSQEIHQKLQDTYGVLNQERKRKRKAKNVPPNLAGSDDIKAYSVTESHLGLHSTSSPGIMCLDVCNDMLVTGGNDKCVTVFNKTTEQIVASFKGHTEKIMQVAYHPEEQIVMSGSMDTTARIWHIPTNQCIQTIRTHENSITGLSLHATGDYLLLSSMDQYWSFVDLRTGAIYAKVLGDDEHGLTSAKFHPDGLIFATGTLSADVKIWDLQSQEKVATFMGHQGPVTAIAFSENGCYLATAAEDCSVKLWDLRKHTYFKTVQMDEGFNITDVTFDFSGSYLALGGNDIRIYECKSGNEIVTFNDHSQLVTGVRFGPNVDWIASASMDRSIKIYSSSK